MSFEYILRRVSAEAGLTKVLQTAQRTHIIDIINEAAEDIYETLDLPGSEREILLRVPSNMMVALPPYVGEPRAFRQRSTTSDNEYHDLWREYGMRSRYVENSSSWAQSWKNFRRKGYSPIQRSIVNAGALTLTIPVIDDTATITITGSTADANRVDEEVVMTALAMTTSNSFTNIERIGSNELRDTNIVITDADANEMATLYNDRLETRYMILDVSRFPTQGGLSDGSFLMEMLYLEPLRRMENNGDKFPADGFDLIIITRALELIAERVQGGEKRALLLNAKIAMMMDKKVKSKDADLSKPIEFQSNACYDIEDRFMWPNSSIL
jgi:hypothetical protein